jgi:hypothetical protein
MSGWRVALTLEANDRMGSNARLLRLSVALAAIMACAGCGALGPLAQLIQPPRFTQTAGHPAEVRFISPSLAHPAGGAGVTVWVDVTNPNPFGFTLSTIDATLSLDGSRAGTTNFPLGLPLQAGHTSSIPIDLSISFADLPGLANVIRNVAGGGSAGYQLDGTIGVDAGRLGQPIFGPMQLATGQLRIR